MNDDLAKRDPDHDRRATCYWRIRTALEFAKFITWTTILIANPPDTPWPTPPWLT